MLPTPEPPPSIDPQGPFEVPPPEYRWYHKIGALLVAILCFEVGLFLFLFPWLDRWDYNYFAGLFPAYKAYWSSPYFRGAVSGLGLVNIYISLVEVVRLRRFGRRVKR